MTADCFPQEHREARMRITAIKTQTILANQLALNELLEQHVKKLKEKSVVAITSKIVALCEGRVVPVNGNDKQELVKQEADYYLPDYLSKYGISFTVTHHTLIPAAGIDESNGNGNYVLWPKDPEKSANEAREYLKLRFGLKNVGVVLTDSTARPLHYGTDGVAISYSGFLPNNNYIGQKDLFGREFKVSISNIADGLASSAVLVMGEGTERTPIAVIEDLPFVNFQDHDPTEAELKNFYLEHMEDDLFAPLLRHGDWQKGDRQK
jgi:dihydrofolate synthase / folylpolyglutamate synthase